MMKNVGFENNTGKKKFQEQVNYYVRESLSNFAQGVGVSATTAQAAMHTPWALQHATTAGMAPTPVVAPIMPPAAVTQVTATKLHPVQQIP